MAGRRLRCSAPVLWGQFVPKYSGFGELPNKHFCGPCALQKFRSVATPELLAKTRNPQHGAKKKEVTLSFTFPPSLSMLSSLGLWLQRFSILFRPRRSTWHQSAFCTRSRYFGTGKSIDPPIYQTL